LQQITAKYFDYYEFDITNSKETNVPDHMLSKFLKWGLYRCKMENYSTTIKNKELTNALTQWLQTIMPTERNQKQKVTYTINLSYDVTMIGQSRETESRLMNTSCSDGGIGSVHLKDMVGFENVCIVLKLRNQFCLLQNKVNTVHTTYY
jgi:hypothetical protein